MLRLYLDKKYKKGDIIALISEKIRIHEDENRVILQREDLTLSMSIKQFKLWKFSLFFCIFIVVAPIIWFPKLLCRIYNLLKKTRA